MQLPTTTILRRSAHFLSLSARRIAGGRKQLRTFVALALVTVSSVAMNGAQSAAPLDLESRANSEYGSLFELYRHLHANPELSFHESKTSERLQQELRRVGFEVMGGVGGYGLVGVLRNGSGP